MAGGIPISAKFDVAIAEPFDSKLESVSTFSELASTSFPYKGMQKLVEDEGDNGIIYHLGTDLTTWSTSTDEDALKQGSNTLTQDLELVRNDAGNTVTTTTTTLDITNIVEQDSFGIILEKSEIIQNQYEHKVTVGVVNNDVLDRLCSISTQDNLVEIIAKDGVNSKISYFNLDFDNAIFSLESGNGIKFNERTTDEANVDFSTDDNNLLSIGKAKENLLQQGSNTLTEELEFNYTGTSSYSATIKEGYSDNTITQKNIEVEDDSGNITTYIQRADLTQIRADGVDSYGNTYSNYLRTGREGSYFGRIEGITDQSSASANGLYFLTENNSSSSSSTAKSFIGTSLHGNGFQYAARALDLANVVWGESDYLNVIPPMGTIIDNTQQKHTVTDFTDAFTIPNGTNNATLTMTNAIDKDVTITTTSFANVGDACELSSLLGVGYPVVVADTGVSLVDPNSVASDSFNIKGLRRMNDIGGVVQIQLY